MLIAFLSLIALMIIHEFGHFIIAKKFGVKVEEFGIGYPPRLFGKQFGDTLYSINLVPLGAFVKIYGEEGEVVSDVDNYRSFSGLAIYKRMLIVLGGVIAFWIASIIIFSVMFLTGATMPVGDQDVAGFTDITITISEVAENSPAHDSGLKEGDKIVSVQVGQVRTDIKKVADFQKIVQENKSKQIIVAVVRQGEELYIPLIPRVEYPEGQGPTGVVLERLDTIIQKAPWYEAPFRGAAYCWKVTVDITYGIFSFFANIFRGQGVPSGAEFAGPVGITIFLARAASYGAGFFLYFIGSISVLLAIFNLLPIPALDGGKLLFLIIEKVKGSAVSVKIEGWLTIFFFILLISMSLFITIKFDFPRVMEFWKAGL